MAPLISIQPGPRNAYTDPDSGLRFYVWRGVEYPSVTSVRNLAGMPHKLSNWRINQVIERAITEYPTLGRMLSDGTEVKAIESWLRKAVNIKRDKAANLGTQVHDAASSGVTIDKAGPEVAPFLLQYYRWMEKSKVEIVAAEKQVWNPSVGYAGTFDMLAKMKGQYWMIDLKTGGDMAAGTGTYPEHALQLEAYARGEFIGEDDVEDTALTAILQQVSGRAILHIRPEGWAFKIIPASQETWVAFRGLLAFARWAHANPNLSTLASRVIESRGTG